LRVFSLDPMRREQLATTSVLDVPYEPLGLGPTGSRLAVVDFDAVRNRFYEPVDLDTPELAVQAGVEPDERDPRFHQQMVYGVASSVLEQFDRAIGRRVRFRRGRLTLYPHAFVGANAFYVPRLKAVAFGYFRAGADAGPNLPGQTVFTCLSHDIIAHEVTHALVDRLRPHYGESPTSSPSSCTSSSRACSSGPSPTPAPSSTPRRPWSTWPPSSGMPGATRVRCDPRYGLPILSPWGGP